MTASSGPPPPDLLVSGEDRTPRSWTRSQRRAGLATVVVLALLAVTVGATALVRADRVHDERQRVAAAARDVVRLVLLERGQDGAPRHGLRPAGVHLVVANTGPAPVRLLRGTLLPGGWQVRVPTDRDLRPGRSVRLELVAPQPCGAREPRALRLAARPPSGRPVVVAMDLAGAQLAYGGRLVDAVRAAQLTCAPASAGPQPAAVRPSR